jgi:hypothetical protein
MPVKELYFPNDRQLACNKLLNLFPNLHFSIDEWSPDIIVSIGISPHSGELLKPMWRLTIEVREDYTIDEICGEIKKYFPIKYTR